MKKGYKDLIVWQKAVNLVVAVYGLTGFFPREEMYGLVSQMRRSAVSISSNIAEGSKRGTKKDFAHFLTMTLGSAGELENQIEIAKRLSFGRNLDYREAEGLIEEVMKMTTRLIQSLKTID